eukprot:SAG31_NODE_19336_length_605_cov_1.213439_1_plen_108_part_01
MPRDRSFSELKDLSSEVLIAHGNGSRAWEGFSEDNGWRLTTPSTWEYITTMYEDTTVFFNDADQYLPKARTIMAAAQDAFGVIPNMNIYMTAPGLQQSVPPHCDQQDI